MQCSVRVNAFEAVSRYEIKFCVCDSWIGGFFVKKFPARHDVTVINCGPVLDDRTVMTLFQALLKTGAQCQTVVRLISQCWSMSMEVNFSEEAIPRNPYLLRHMHITRDDEESRYLKGAVVTLSRSITPCSIRPGPYCCVNVPNGYNNTT